MSYSIGCCGSHLECQKTGVCVNQTDVNCGLYESTIQYKFETLYKLKEMGLVSVEDNHLTDKGIAYVKKQLGQLSPAALLLTELLVLGLDNNSRINVRTLKSKHRLLTKLFK